MRSALTVLGVIIGVASVIAMVALGAGRAAAIDAQIQSTGTNVVYVSSGSSNRRGGAHGGIGAVQTLTLEDAAAIARAGPDRAARSTPVVRGRAQVVGRQPELEHVDRGRQRPEYLSIAQLADRRGANISPRDVLRRRQGVPARRHGGQDPVPAASDPVGQIVRVKNLPFRVIGVLAPKGQGQWGQDQDDIVIAPYTTIQKKLLGITEHPPGDDLGQRRRDAVEATAVQPRSRAAAPAPPHQRPGARTTSRSAIAAEMAQRAAALARP